MRKILIALIALVPSVAGAQTVDPNPTFITAWTNHGNLATALGLGSLAGLSIVPAPSLSVRGGVKSITCSVSQFVSGIDTSGNPVCATPTTGSSTAAAGASGEFQTNSGGNLAGVAITGAVTIDGTTGVSTLAPGQAVANLGFTPVNKAGDVLSGSLITLTPTFPKWFLSSTTNATNKKNAQGFVSTDGNFYLSFVNDTFDAIDAIFIAYNPTVFGDPPLVSFAGSVTAQSFQAGTAQTNVGQLGQITSPYVTGMINTQNDIFRVQLGGFDASNEFSALNGNGNHTLSAITAAVAQPSGTTGYVGDVTWPDSAFAAYGLSQQTQKSMIGYLSYMGVNRDNGLVQVLNGVATNCPLGNTDTCTGFNASWVVGAEVDVAVRPLAGGAHMTGAAVGYSAYMDARNAADISSLGVNTAFRALGQGAGKWNAAFESVDNAANIALNVGLNAIPTPGVGTPSQPIFFNTYDGANRHFPQIYGNSDGSMQLIGSGIVMAGAPVTGLSFAGVTQYSFLTEKASVSRTSGSSAGSYFDLTTTEGGDTASNYTAASVSAVTVVGHGTTGFGGNFVCTLGGSLIYSATVGCNGMEIDVSNADADRVGSIWTSPNRALGLLVSGSGIHRNNTGIEITSSRSGGPLWEVGLRFSQSGSLGSASIQNASVQDESSSGTSYNDVGSHTFGLTLAGTYSTTPIHISPFAGGGARSLCVDNSGNVYAHAAGSC